MSDVSNIRNDGRIILPDRIVVQGAMEVEVEEFLMALEKDSVQTKTIGAHTFYEGLLCIDDPKKEGLVQKSHYVTLIVSRTYIGMVNTAQATVLAANFLNPTAIINQGVAGGHDPNLRRGDLVIGTEAVNFSAVVTSVKGRGQGHDLLTADIRDTEIPLSATGKNVLNEHDVFRVDPNAPNANNYEDEKISGKGVSYELPEPIVVKTFPCSREWVNIAKLVATDMFDYKGDDSVFDSGMWVEGPIGSADNWNRELDEIYSIHQLTGSLCEEMESSAAAQVCKSYGIPFFVTRILSNSEWSAEDYEPRTAIKCEQFVLETIKEFCRQKMRLN